PQPQKFHAHFVSLPRARHELRSQDPDFVGVLSALDVDAEGRNCPAWQRARRFEQPSRPADLKQPNEDIATEHRDHLGARESSVQAHRAHHVALDRPPSVPSTSTFSRWRTTPSSISRLVAITRTVTLT